MTYSPVQPVALSTNQVAKTAPSRVFYKRVLRWQALTQAACALALATLATAAMAQVCASPGKDGPGNITTPATGVNTYFEGSGNLAVAATTLTLGTRTGVATAVTVGDKLLVIQMQGAEINPVNSTCYGANVGGCTQSLTRVIGGDKARGYLDNANFSAGRYEYVRVTAISGGGAAGSAVTFTPALVNAYSQTDPTLVLGQTRYQVLRVPQYSTLNVSGQIVATRWDGLTGGVVAIDVAGAVNFSGAGPHIDVSGTGFRTGYGERGGVEDGATMFMTNAGALTAIRDTTKGEGIAGTPLYMWIPTDPLLAPLALTGAALTNPRLNANGQGYPGGDHGRGAPGNAGGGGIGHNSAGGGGGNGGAGGAGGATFSGDGSRDVGGYGGGPVPQGGTINANRLVMGGGGGAGDVNGGGVEPTDPYEGPGGVGGGIILINAAQPAGSGYLRANGTQGPIAYFDAAGGGGAGGSIRLNFAANTGGVRLQADGGQGGIHDATGLATHCSGSGGGAGGGALVANGAISGSSSANGGLQGGNPPDNPVNCQGDAGEVGAFVNSAPSSQVGVQPGYQCLPVLGVTKSTSTPTRTLPGDTLTAYQIIVTNTGGGTAFGVGVQDVLPAPFVLTSVGATATAVLTNASGPAPVANTSGALTSATFGVTGGTSANSFAIAPGGTVVLTFATSITAAGSGTYQNGALVRYTDPLRTTGGAADAGGNPSVSPGGSYAGGGTVPGTNYAAASSTLDDVVIASPTAPTQADLAITKTGSAAVFVGDAVNYVINVSNAGPANAGTVTVADTVPGLIGTVTWACTVVGGGADCDVPAAGTGASGSGNSINLPRVSLNSGGAIQITVSGTAAASGTVTNVASALLNTPGLTDPISTNNAATATTVIAPRLADLNISKSNGVGTLTFPGATTYIVSVGNAGPAPGDGAVVSDPAGAGLTKLSVTCTAFGGAVCPSGLSTATFQAGIAVPVLPVGGTLSFALSAQVTAAAGSRVTNTASVTAASGTTDPALADNTAVDVDPVVASVVEVISAPGICPASTVEQTLNLLSNGDLSNTLASVGSNVPQFPVDTYPPDTSVSVQQGAKNYVAGVVIQSPFTGDPARSIAGTNNWLYNNGNNLGGVPYRIYRQQLSGLVVGRQYLFMYYGSNALTPGTVAADVPNISIRVAGTSTVSLATNTFANEPTGGTDTWTLRQASFTASTATMAVELWDAAGGIAGDDFASTQYTVRECRPTADPQVLKTDFVSGVTTLTTTTYRIVVSNPGPGAANGVTVKDLFVTGLQKDGVSCVANAFAQCPISVTVAGLEGAGLFVPQLSAGGAITLTVPTTIQALSGTLTNTAVITIPSDVIDVNLLNNTSSDVNTVTGLVNLQISKTNGAGSLAAGQTTGYTITLANFGPSFADNAVLTDPVAAGLSCSGNATCTSNDGNFAICPGGSVGTPNTTFTVATLQSLGVTIPRLRPSGTLTIRMTCGVTATGL